MRSTVHISKHPLFPFIEIGRAIDFAKRNGNALEIDLCNESSDEWSFRFEGCDESPIVRSEVEAIIEAEKQLFLKQPDLVRERIGTALDNDDLKLAMLLSERAGYRAGKRDEKIHIHAAIVPIIRSLQNIQAVFSIADLK